MIYTETDPADEAHVKTASERIQDALLWLVFLAMISAAGYVLMLDYRYLQYEDRLAGIEDTREPVPMMPVSPSDQIRPYVPGSRPVGPSREAPDLSPFKISPDMPEREPMVFSSDGNGALLAFGTISPGTADIFERTLDSLNEPVTEIVLHSPGGSVQDALTMAQLIRDKELNTRIIANGYCASSCPLVFAGGVKREAHETAWIGVHQVYAPPSTFGSIQQGMDDAQRISAQTQQALLDFGVDPVLWIKAMETPKDQLYVLTAHELEELKLATSVEFEPDQAKSSNPS